MPRFCAFFAAILFTPSLTVPLRHTPRMCPRDSVPAETSWTGKSPGSRDRPLRLEASRVDLARTPAVSAHGCRRYPQPTLFGRNGPRFRFICESGEAAAPNFRHKTLHRETD